MNPSDAHTENAPSPGRSVYLMMSLFVLLLVYPALDRGRWGGLFVSICFSVVLLAALWAVQRSKRLLVLGCSLGSPWLVLNWTGSVLDLPVFLEYVRNVLLVIFIFFVAGSMLWFLMRSRRVTLDTLGYGDIAPASPAAKAAAMLESVIGPLFLAVLIARLVGIYIRGESTRDQSHTRPVEGGDPPEHHRG